jgi:hypothetical protein
MSHSSDRFVHSNGQPLIIMNTASIVRIVASREKAMLTRSQSIGMPTKCFWTHHLAFPPHGLVAKFLVLRTDTWLNKDNDREGKILMPSGPEVTR